MNTEHTGKYWSGTSGLVIPLPNKAAFPPEFRDKSRLTYYASLFNSIEVNSSFYKVPMAATVGKWAESVPRDFKFTFKLWKEITHIKGLNAGMESIDAFMKVIEQAGDKKGCLLVQFPPSVTIATANRVEEILHRIRDIDKGWKTAVEFRHPSWYNKEIYALADALEMSIVLHDMPASLNTKLNEKAPFVYIRFHGEKGDYKGGYTDAVLEKYALTINKWMLQGRDVYVYFNNTIGDAVSNLMTLNKLVDAKKALMNA
jgi:uncharacterized protein YecE (DUF72 family)